MRLLAWDAYSTGDDALSPRQIDVRVLEVLTGNIEGELGRQLCLSNPKSVEEAVDSLRVLVNEGVSENSKTTIAPITQESTHTQKGAGKGAGRGGAARGAARGATRGRGGRSGQPAPQQKETRTCYICGKVGHLAADCRSGRQQQQQHQPQQRYNNNQQYNRPYQNQGRGQYNNRGGYRGRPQGREDYRIHPVPYQNHGWDYGEGNQANQQQQQQQPPNPHNQN